MKNYDYFKIVYNVNGVKFTYNTPNVSEAFDAIRAIIKREIIMFPDQEKTFCEYFEILSNMAFGKTIKHDNHIFTVERV